MIKKVVLQKFKQFKHSTIEILPTGVTLISGENNSGKTSLLHALAIWNFCKTILINEKGVSCLFQDSASQGLGISDDEFIPISLPSLRHLWTNLKTQKTTETDGYTLKICCYWDDPMATTGANGVSFLEFGLSLANDRLFIKATNSNIDNELFIPNIAYLPPFAGITDKESRIPPAIRQRLIGQGLSGAILRNLLLDMYNDNQTQRKEMKADKPKIKNSDLARLRATDPWEILSDILRTLFHCELYIYPFNDLYNSYIKIEIAKGTSEKNRFKAYPGYIKRDLMSEGSGFLQWLSVYTLLLNPKIDTILLDEPDAHLHSSLQNEMTDRMMSIAIKMNKQILVTSHSSEIIKRFPYSQIIRINNRRCKYLASEQEKVPLLQGLGSEYAPRLNQLQLKKNILFIENESDARLLKIWCEALGLAWPENVVIWVNNSSCKDKKILFTELQKEIPTLCGISLRDRDDENINTVGDDLIDKTYNNNIPNFSLMKWKRKNIENYLLAPEAIAKASNSSLDDVKSYIADNFSLQIPPNYTIHAVTSALLEANGKEIIYSSPNSICKHFRISREDICNGMEPDQICDDCKRIVATITTKYHP